MKSRQDAVEKLDWYAHRWKIETFHKVLKSGCRAEDLKLRSAERLVNAVAVFCILSWRIFWLTMMKRADPEGSPRSAFTQIELRLLDQLVTGPGPSPRTLSNYVIKLAKLGGYLGRRGDPSPGNMVVWRGLSRLTDIELGFALGAENVGNR